MKMVSKIYDQSLEILRYDQHWVNYVKNQQKNWKLIVIILKQYLNKLMKTKMAIDENEFLNTVSDVNTSMSGLNDKQKKL